MNQHFAKQRQEKSKNVNITSWGTLCKPGATAEHYRQGLRWAETTCRLQPGDGNISTR
jgi:hypothetical protein